MRSNVPPILELRGISKTFGGLTALNRISLTVGHGEICGLIGPNGAGKSTLLSVVSGSARPTDGDVLYRGENIAHFPMHRRARLGLVRTFQLAHTFETMSVEDNVLVGVENHTHLNLVRAMTSLRGRPPELAERAARIMDMMGIAHLARHSASQLTFGQQRMVATGRALAGDPQLLLLDEPAAGLSTKDIDVLMKAIRDIRERGTTVMIVEHNMDVIMQLCDHVVVVHLGEKIGDGRPDEVRQSERVLEAYLGT